MERRNPPTALFMSPSSPRHPAACEPAHGIRSLVLELALGGLKALAECEKASFLLHTAKSNCFHGDDGHSGQFSIEEVTSRSIG